MIPQQKLCNYIGVLTPRLNNTGVERNGFPFHPIALIQIGFLLSLKKRCDVPVISLKAHDAAKLPKCLASARLRSSLWSQFVESRQVRNAINRSINRSRLWWFWSLSGLGPSHNQPPPLEVIVVTTTRYCNYFLSHGVLGCLLLSFPF